VRALSFIVVEIIRQSLQEMCLLLSEIVYGKEGTTPLFLNVELSKVHFTWRKELPVPIV